MSIDHTPWRRRGAGVGLVAGILTLTLITPAGATALADAPPSSSDNAQKAALAVGVQAESLTITSVRILNTPAKIGYELTAYPTLEGGWADGLTYSYQWLADGEVIPAATQYSFTPTSAQAGKAISVEVVAKAPGYEDSVPVRSAETNSVEDELQGFYLVQANISGKARVGGTLTVEPTSYPDAAGKTQAYQWFADGVAIDGATTAQIALDDSLVGKLVTVELTVSAPGFRDASVTSDAVGPVTADFDSVTVDIDNKAPKSGQTLTASAVTVPAQPAGLAVSYEWYADGRLIAGVTGATYTPGESEVGKAIQVYAIASADFYGPTESAGFAQTAAVQPAEVASDARAFFQDVLTNSRPTTVMAIASADEVLSGDWDGDGIDTLVLRHGTTYTFFASNLDGSAQTSVSLGEGTPVVGDFNGDGKDDVAVRAPGSNSFALTYNVNGAIPAGVVNATVYFGKATDVPFAGDWNGDGKDTLGVQQGNKFMLTNNPKGGNSDISFYYGRPGFQVIVGDFDGDGKDTIAVAHDYHVYVKNTLEKGDADITLKFGRESDVRVAGDWFGTGMDTLAAVRG